MTTPIDYGRNWSKNIQFHAQKVLFPTTVDEVIAIVKNTNYVSLKAFGSRHCFNSIADTALTSREASSAETTHVHLCMENMTGIKIHSSTETTPATAEFEAGVTFTQLMDAVSKAGYALASSHHCLISV